MARSTQVEAGRPGRTRRISRNRGAPRYRQLADRLIEDIRCGRRPVGSTLPNELELMDEFGVSRHTVREALRRLDAIGLIERRRRLGTLVRACEPTESYQHSVRSLGDLLQYPADSRLEKLDVEDLELDADTARLLGCRSRSRWRRLGALRRIGGQGAPLCRVDIYLRPDLAAVAKDVGRSRLRVFELIERRFGLRVAHVRVDVSAQLLEPAVARVLDVAVSSPSLRVVRRYYDDAAELFEATVSDHPADRFSFSLDLRREWLRATEDRRLTRSPVSQG